MLNERNIAVFLPTWVGDAVMATPALRALRRGAPQARITYVGAPAALQTLESAPFFDAQIADAARDGRGKARFLSLARAIRHGRFDLMVLLTNSFRSAAAASLAGVPRLAGYARDGRGWLLTDRLNPPRGIDGRFEPIAAGDYYQAEPSWVLRGDGEYRLLYRLSEVRIPVDTGDCCCLPLNSPPVAAPV